jgi:excisionase family DNA binding protein
MKLLTVPQAAERLGISERRVRKLLSEGRIRALYIGRRWLIDTVDCHFIRKPQGNFRAKGKGKKSNQVYRV